MTHANRDPNPDDRGMSTPLSHVLSIGITTLLIIALVASATGFLDTHTQRSATDELRTIGNRMAGELAQVDALARDGDSVSVTTRHPETIAGSTYTARIVNGSSICGNLTDTCLELSTSQHDVTAIVPVHNETNLELTSHGGGRFVMSSPGGSGTAQADPRRLRLSPRVGVGQGVGTGPSLGVGSSLTESPQARTEPAFLIDPPTPLTNETVTFDASPVFDPDGTIDTYDWDFDGDGTFEVTGSTSPTETRTFTDAGDHEVTVRATDDSGLTGLFTRRITVGGLEYSGDLQTDGANDRVTFTVTNRFSQPVHIERLTIDPFDDGVDELVEDEPQSGTDEDTGPPHEIEIDEGDDGSIDGYVDWDIDDGGDDGLEIIDGGPIVNVDDDGDRRGSDVTVPAGGVTRISLQEFDRNVDGEKMNLGVRYRIGSNVKWSRFNATVAP